MLTLAAVGTGVLWLDSYRKPRGHDLVYVGLQYVGGYHREWELRAGQLEFEYEYNVPRSSISKTSSSSFSFLGFRIDYEVRIRDKLIYGHFTQPLPVSEQTASRYIYVWLPLWPFITLFAVYPTIAFIRGPVRRYRRRKRGLYVECGYNLTGNKSGVCPECGTWTEGL